ncbi:hypothetical protein [Streptomyces sp. NPDC005167]
MTVLRDLGVADKATKAPKPSSIVEEPATIAACRSDYESAAEARATFARQQRTRR